MKVPTPTIFPLPDVGLSGLILSRRVQVAALGNALATEIAKSRSESTAQFSGEVDSQIRGKGCGFELRYHDSGGLAASYCFNSLVGYILRNFISLKPTCIVELPETVDL